MKAILTATDPIRPRSFPPMKIAFIADPLDTFQIYKDTTFAMMREAAARGHALYFDGAARPRCGGTASFTGNARRLALTGQKPHWYRVERARASRRSASSTRCIMRKDPPFDMEYVYSTYLLEFAEAQGARVFNRPRAIRDYNEKMGIAHFTQFIAPSDRDAQRGPDPRVSGGARRRDPEAARRHGRHLDLQGAPRRSQPERHHRDRHAVRPPDHHGPALHSGDQGR